MASSYDWNYHLAVDDLNEFSNALRHFSVSSFVDQFIDLKAYTKIDISCS